MCISIEKGNLEIIKLLLTREEIDVNAKTIYKEYANDKYDYEKAPLHLAIEKGNLEILKLLLSFPSIDINSFEINTYNSSSSNYAIINSTALHYSVLTDNFEIFKLLLSHQDIDVNLCYFNEYRNNIKEETVNKNALSLAIEKKNPKMIEMLLMNPNTDVNFISTSVSYEFNKFSGLFDEIIAKYSILHLAYLANYEIFNLIFSNPSIDVNALFFISYLIPDFTHDSRKIKQKTILHISLSDICDDGDNKLKLIISNKNIDPNIKSISRKFKDDEKGLIYETKTERTPLYIAFQKGRLDFATKYRNFNVIIELLLAHPNININLNSLYYYYEYKNYVGECRISYDSLLSYAIHVLKNDVLTKILLKQPYIDVNNKNISAYFENTKKSYAYSICEDDLVDYDEESPLILAFFDKNFSIGSLLLENLNIDVNIKYFIFNNYKDKNIIRFEETNALFYEVEDNNIENTKLLLKNPKMNPNKVLLQMIEMDNRVIYYKEIVPLHLAIKNQNIELVELFLDIQFIDVNIKKIKTKESNYEEKVPLYYAIEKGRIDIIKLLLKNKSIDVNSETIIQYQEENTNYLNIVTPLYAAFEQENNEIFQLLLLHPNIDVNIKEIINKNEEKMEMTILHMAVLRKKIDIILLLLTHPNIDVNIKCMIKDDNDINEETALHIAVVNNDYEIIEMLLNHDNIDIYVTNKEDETPFELTNNDEIIQLFNFLINHMDH